MKDCYAALGCIHGRWRPVVGRFKDYIAMPKFNLYQSLHTTVIGPMGKPIEVQIRTTEMHRRAEWGVAAHWAYKGGARDPTSEIDWLKRIIDWQEDISDPAQFMQSLKTDLEQDEVFVFTPKGRVITLPSVRPRSTSPTPCTPRSGHACIGAKVNNRLVSLDHVLNSGDNVEIFTSKVETAGPSQDWLAFVVSPRARNKIRQWFSRERRIDMIEVGRDDLTAEMRRERLPVQQVWKSPQLKEVVVELSYVDLDALLAAIGEHHVSAKTVAQRIGRSLRGGDDAAQLPATVDRPRRERRDGSRTRVGRARRGPRRRARAPRQLLHPGARRRHHRVRHPWSRRERAPVRLRERGVADGRAGDADDRGRMGRAGAVGRHVRRRRRGGRARPVAPVA